MTLTIPAARKQGHEEHSTLKFMHAHDVMECWELVKKTNRAKCLNHGCSIEYSRKKKEMEFSKTLDEVKSEVKSEIITERKAASRQSIMKGTGS